MKLWAGRFSKATNKLVDEYNASIGFDYKLAEYDIQGSLAHVKMLEKMKLISKQDELAITEGLLKILDEAKNSEIEFKESDEDIHMNVERLLYEKVGEVAGKLHTGRSRNDQVALDLHLYLRDHIKGILAQLIELLKVLYLSAVDNIDTFLPGYTHLQRAEPVRLAHHFLAYFWMFTRDVERLCDVYARVNVSPLGAGALAGSGVMVDPVYTAEILSFQGIYNNSLDAVSDRDFVVEFLSSASIIMMHISRFSEELILWSSHEFSFIQLGDDFCTGSSMMPQKKNPDVCELARGKTGRVYGSLFGLLTVLKGLPLAYNKDMQEDKEGLFDTVKTISQTLAVFTPMIAAMKVNKDKMKAATESDYSNATNLANYLTKKNIPFREAHEITGKIVSHCLEKDILLIDLPIASYQSFSDKIDTQVYACLTVESVIEEHKTINGTSKASVEVQITRSTDTLKRLSERVEAL